MSDTLESSALTAEDTLQIAVEVVIAYLANNKIAPDLLPEFIDRIHRAISSLNSGHTDLRDEKQRPAVPVRKSIGDDYIVCLEDGKRLKMLKRYLRATYNMSPDEYRKRWGLPADYPMVAPACAAKRSELAKRIGLGRGVRRK